MVELTDGEAEFVAALLGQQFGKVYIPPNLAPLVAGLLARLPGWALPGETGDEIMESFVSRGCG